MAQQLRGSFVIDLLVLRTAENPLNIDQYGGCGGITGRAMMMAEESIARVGRIGNIRCRKKDESHQIF